LAKKSGNFIKLPRVKRLKDLNIPRIHPMLAGQRQPFWSVMIPTYNCASYLARTLSSILQQDQGNQEMQIEVVDDCSSEDDPEAVVEEVGKGRVSFFRQPCNVGVTANFNTCIERARGRWVHILHGDDLALPGFYVMHHNIISTYPQVIMVFCRAIAVDENDEWLYLTAYPPGQKYTGLVEGMAHKVVAANFVTASAVVVARSAFEKVGGFSQALAHCADWEMWMRLALTGPVGYIHQPYLLYRKHSGSDTNRLAQRAHNIREIAATIEIGARRLPTNRQNQARTEAYRNYANYANSFRINFHTLNDHRAALRHALWTIRLFPSMENLLRLVQSAYLIARDKASQLVVARKPVETREG